MTRNVRPIQFKPLDGGWGWAVVASAFFCVFLLSTSVTSFAILYEEFVRSFGMSRSMGGWVGSTQLALAFVNSIPTGVLVQYFGCRPVCIAGFFISSVGLAASHWAVNHEMLFVTYGVITGLGLGLAMLPVFVCVQHYFDRRRALAVGLAMCGLNLSSLVTGPLLRLTIDHFGWRGATLLHAGVMLQGVLLACVFRPLPPINPPPRRRSSTTTTTAAAAAAAARASARTSARMSSTGSVSSNSTASAMAAATTEDSTEAPPAEHVDINPAQDEAEEAHKSGSDCCASLVRLFDFGLLKEKRFMLYVLGNFFINFSCMTFLQHIVSFGILQGVDKSRAALLPTVTGVCSAVSRILSGCIADRKSVDRRYMCASFAIVGGAGVCFSFLGTDFLSIAILAGIFGVSSGTFTTLQYTVLVDLVGVARIAQAQAFFSAFMGSSSLFSGPLAGFLVDKTGAYNLPFFMSGILHVAGGAILLVVGYLHFIYITSASYMNGHVTGNGHVRAGAAFGNKVSQPERVELIITTV